MVLLRRNLVIAKKLRALNYIVIVLDKVNSAVLNVIAQAVEM
jgi:hypothetical protein